MTKDKVYVYNLLGQPYQVILKYGKYSNGRTAIELETTNTEWPEPFMTASVNLHDLPMEEDEIAIKNYSENVGVLEWLVEHGIVSEPLRYASSGFVTVPICKLLVKP